jgi:hypothetical protein
MFRLATIRKASIWTNVMAILTATSAYFAGTATLEVTIGAVAMAVINVVLALLGRDPLPAAGSRAAR